MSADTQSHVLQVRPYQLLCVVCRNGGADEAHVSPRAAEIAAWVAAAPDAPLAIVCNAGDVYRYQDPGAAEDMHGSEEFNRKRDLDILQKTNWPPGIALPARTAFLSLLSRIGTVAGVCGYETVTAEAWQGCPNAHGGGYERGRELGVGAIIPPRPAEELAAEKRRSLQVLRTAGEVTIRPHILLCAVCQYGAGVRPPFAADNLPELLQIILHEKPQLPLCMARQADWMMCAPCPNRAPELNACVNVLGSGGLSNEKRDLDMLQRLGLRFGDVMPARELYRLIFRRIPATQGICAREGSHCPSVWWDGCGESNVALGNQDYQKGRRELMAALELVE